MDEIKSIGFLVADLVLILAGTVYGWKLLKKGNSLLGLECWIVAISATNLLFSALLFDFPKYRSTSLTLYSNAIYLDAFSRSVGFPLIGIAGLLAVTHFYKPSTAKEILWFAAGFAVAAVLIIVTPENRTLLGQYGENELVIAIEECKPWFYLSMWTFCSCFLTYFAWRLFRAGENLHGWSITIAILSSQSIAIIYDFFSIPGDDAEHTLFYTAAMLTWAYLIGSLYHAYTAIERNGQKPIRPEPVNSCR